MLPLLTAAADWIAPAFAINPEPVTHFGQRAAERGVDSIPGDLLKWAIERAVGEGREDLVEPVFLICSDSRLFRVMLPEGVFFPVIKGRVAVTIYSAEMVRQLRRARRRRKREQGRRQRGAQQ
jgi:hypothetical protein